MANRFFPFTLSTHQEAHQQAAVSLFAPHAADRALALARTAAGAAADTTPIDQQLADSFNANNAIFTYVVAMQNTTLPPVAGDWYTTFQQAFHDAAVHASEWSTYSAALTAVPAGIANFATAFTMNMTTINTYANIVKLDPSNTAALNSLVASIQSLLTAVQSQKTGAAAVIPQLNTFASQLVSDQTVMKNAIASALNQQGADQTSIDQLNADIATLQADIAKWNTVITAVAIAGGIGIFIGCVSAIFSFGLGLVFAVASAAATIATIIIAQQKIKADYSTIQGDEAQIGTLNTEIAALSTLQTNLNNLINLSNQAQQQLQLILTAWQQLETEIQAVINDLQGATGATNPLNVDTLLADLNAANSDWQTLVQFCNVLKGINYTILPGTTNLVAA